MELIKSGKLSFACIRHFESGENLAEVEITNGNTNLAHLFRRYETVNLCTSERAARELAEYWNLCFLENGTLEKSYVSWYEKEAERRKLASAI